MPRKPTGQLSLCKSGWHARYLATVNGERKYVFVNLETRNELIARRKLAALVEAEEAGKAPVLVETFEMAAKRVHEMRAKTVPSARGELSYMRRHVNPAIGAIPAAEVTKADVLVVLESVRDKGRAAQTILHCRNAIAAVFRQLRREGAVQELPVPGADELPDALPEAIDDRPKAVLTDDELLIYLTYTDAREAEKFRGPVRERQMMALLARCVGGMRTSEVQGLTWARAQAADAFDALEVVRYKTKKKASTKGSKAVARQLYPLGDTVLPAFLRYWHARVSAKAGRAPTLDAVLFPVSRDRGRGENRLGQRRGASSWADALRRDVSRAFEAAIAARKKAGQSVEGIPAPGSRRWAELFEGTEDRRPLWFHNARNAAAIQAERFERLKAAARFTAHASGQMLQHYRAMAGEIDVVPVAPELLPDGDQLLAILRTWCKADGIDSGLVFPPSEEPGETALRNHVEEANDAQPPKVIALPLPKALQFREFSAKRQAPEPKVTGSNLVPPAGKAR